jgi:tRNA-specific 2-thiouridylase
MTFPLTIPDPLRRVLPPGTGVLLGISGGVDSAVALAVLRALGCEVLCVTFKNFCYSEEEIDLTDKSCCSLEAIEDARRLARRFQARHWVRDVSERFTGQVIQPFVAEYQAARTPNPCLACNADVRFPELVQLARQQGCRYAATGHYARIVQQEGELRLATGLDPAKDQSYFLHRIDRALFGELVFPLGWWNKSEVRTAARELGIEVADKRDSQEICFVPDDDRSFLFPEGDQPGDVVDRQGKVLGRHRGLQHYTVGQRKGLGIAADRPLYVLALEKESNRVILGYREELDVAAITADRFRPVVGEFPACRPGNLDHPGRFQVRIRHRHEGTPVLDWRREKDILRVELAEPVAGAAPGQGLVLYDGETVLGGGRIIESSGVNDSGQTERET